MSTPIDNEKYPPSGDGAKLPGLAAPSTDINQLRNVVDNLKEIVETREGRRGSKYDQAITWRDLYNVGLVAIQSGGNTYINQTNSGGVSAVTLLAPNLQALMASEFDKKVKASGAYKDLTTEIGVAAAYKGAPQEVIDILTSNLSDESIKRGADIRKVETKIQEVDKSLAISVRELTAGIDSAQASAREVMYSSATRDQATAGVVTTINARLNNFGGGGVTVEQKMTATINRVTGLEGIYSVKIVIDNLGVPYITGFALSSTVTAGGAATSSFVVNASNFAIYRPGTTSVAPFGVDAGTNTVFINGTLLINSGGTSINALSAASTAATSSITTKLSKAGADVLTGPISLQASNTILVGTTNDGIAIGSSGIIGRKASVTTFSIAADGSATFSGDVITSGRLEMSGTGYTYSGAVPGGNALSYMNASNSTYGLYVNHSTGGVISAAILGKVGGTSGVGVQGESTSTNVGAAIRGLATAAGSFNTSAVQGIASGGGSGVAAQNSGSGVGLYCDNKFQWGAYTATAPNGSASNFLNGQGNWVAASSGGVSSLSASSSSSGLTLSASASTGAVTLTLAGTPTNATNATYSDYLGGVIASSWARIFPTNSGTANAGGSGLNILGSGSTGIVGAYVGTSGTSNIVTIEVQTTSPSDIRLKEEIADSNLGLAFVNKLRPVSYKLKADPKHQKGYGFIADEVDQIIETGSSLVYFEPDWKVGDETGFKTIHYPSYVAVLTKAIQELSAKVAVLESANV